jgi:hypothetical protein
MDVEIIMKLNPAKMKTVETDQTNPMVMAVRHDPCPLNDDQAACAYIAAGFGSVLRKCDHFREPDECTFGPDPDMGKG